MSARKARRIRRSAQNRSANRDGLGISELFTAPPSHVDAILAAHDFRLKRYLLGY
ncbi:MAG: hypothetical protein ACE5EC_09925 [Phycisphaerae bacterium]